MIRNNNGTPYQLKSSLQQFDPGDPAFNLFNQYDEELIRISGTPVFYYEILIQFQSMDKLYLEDRSKLFHPNPIQLYSFYEPPQQSNMSGIFSVDTPDEEILMEFNYQAVLGQLNHPPKIGSRIFTPHRGENWIIIDRRLDGFKLWQAFHLVLLCKKWQDDAVTGAGEVGQPQPDFKING
jgi:hypothetical protein